jgi:hypothetical protein
MNYRSKTTLLGLPLVHVATATKINGTFRRGVARGWIAVGDISFGLLVSVGGVAFGAGLTFGGLGLGLICFSGLSVGMLLALGGLAVGYLAVGGAAIGVKAAAGGFAVARDYALGGSAVARHANDAAAQQFFQEDLLVSAAQFVAAQSHWLMLLIAIPLLLAVLERRKRTEQGPRAPR